MHTSGFLHVCIRVRASVCVCVCQLEGTTHSAYSDTSSAMAFSSCFKASDMSPAQVTQDRQGGVAQMSLYPSVLRLVRAGLAPVLRPPFARLAAALRLPCACLARTRLEACTYRAGTGHRDP